MNQKTYSGSFSLKYAHFCDLNTEGDGGSVRAELGNGQVALIDSCHFDKCTAGRNGGACSITTALEDDSISVHIISTVTRQCYASSYGLGFHVCTTNKSHCTMRCLSNAEVEHTEDGLDEGGYIFVDQTDFNFADGNFTSIKLGDWHHGASIWARRANSEIKRVRVVDTSNRDVNFYIGSWQDPVDAQKDARVSFLVMVRNTAFSFSPELKTGVFGTRGQTVLSRAVFVSNNNDIQQHGNVPGHFLTLNDCVFDSHLEFEYSFIVSGNVMGTIGNTAIDFICQMSVRPISKLGFRLVHVVWHLIIVL